jgi:hypothetical protein
MSDTAPGPDKQPKQEKGDGTAAPNVTPLRDARTQAETDKVALDEFEQLAADTILDDDEGDEPGTKDEITTPLVVKNLPRFANFRANKVTFDLWGATDRQGMDDLLYVTTKSFAPNFEDDLDLRRVRFFETVTSDSVVRLVYCFVPEKTGRKANTWTASKLSALEQSQSVWTTMRSRKKLEQYTYRQATKDYGEPKFSGLTPAQHVANLKKLGLLVDTRDHPFYRKATDTEE